MHRKKHIWCSVMIFLIVAFDQITKKLAVDYLANGDVIEFIPNVVQFRLSLNTGMAFSFLSGARWFFVALTFIVCAFIFVVMFTDKCDSLAMYWSLGVVAAGGLGNLIDRALNGYVVDFIEPIFMNFAIFNIADCAVTCGSVFLVIRLCYDLFKKDKSE